MRRHSELPNGPACRFQITHVLLHELPVTSASPAPGAAAPELPVMEQFYTIQGEGYNTGRAAYFIRLGGCDVGCVWCDVKESWPLDAHPRQQDSHLRTLQQRDQDHQR